MPLERLSRASWLRKLQSWSTNAKPGGRPWVAASAQPRPARPQAADARAAAAALSLEPVAGEDWCSWEAQTLQLHETCALHPSVTIGNAANHRLSFKMEGKGSKHSRRWLTSSSGAVVLHMQHEVRAGACSSLSRPLQVTWKHDAVRPQQRLCPPPGAPAHAG